MATLAQMPEALLAALFVLWPEATFCTFCTVLRLLSLQEKWCKGDGMLKHLVIVMLAAS